MSTNVDDHDSAGSFHGGAQHELSKSAFGSLVAEAVTLDSPEMRVLDVGTGDGYWLYDLRSQLHDPENADLVGTDAAIMPAEQRPFTIPQNMRFLAQSPRDDWPNDIHGYFDLVHWQHVISSSESSFEKAVEITGRLLRLLKPGGTLLLVDRCFEPSALATTDTPSKQLFQMLGNGLSSGGTEGTLGGDLPAILDVASHSSGVRLNDVGMKKSASRIGEGAEAHGKELGLAWLKQLKGDRSGSRSKADTDRFDEIVEQAVEEAESQGFEVVWYAAWAKRSGGDANGAIEMPA
ncbi:hypothetical protein CB0940_05948 [Cercospora beticola]|uniref:Methyltransferase domain-containing protein n=1 Tax=Cercospora beticola TaxID=122368 RepID=A0A2G5HX93_CERBT|nr:hypothetical protein CB0940_05948 [Cercospora beticola]PIA97165.1 hypothetical protein CB0940_05948 [Cercospora beticola]WPA98546.1 hypothetical protein RHO25_003158 [Cercospora beticola]